MKIVPCRVGALAVSWRIDTGGVGRAADEFCAATRRRILPPVETTEFVVLARRLAHAIAAAIGPETGGKSSVACHSLNGLSI